MCTCPPTGAGCGLVASQLRRSHLGRASLWSTDRLGPSWECPQGVHIAQQLGSDFTGKANKTHRPQQGSSDCHDFDENPLLAYPTFVNLTSADELKPLPIGVQSKHPVTAWVIALHYKNRSNWLLEGVWPAKIVREDLWPRELVC